MPTIKEIRDTAKLDHDSLSEVFYAQKGTVGVTSQEQADFDLRHANIWADMETAIKLASDYVEPILPRDLVKEITELQEKVFKLEEKLLV